MKLFYVYILEEDEFGIDSIVRRKQFPTEEKARRYADYMEEAGYPASVRVVEQDADSHALDYDVEKIVQYIDGMEVA